MSYRCCSMIQSFALNVNGRIDTGEPVLSLCCENLPGIPRVAFGETAEDTLRSFAGEGLLAAVECARAVKDSQRHFTAGCVHCAQFQEGEYAISPLIGYVNLSMYPAPCQSRCVYCEVCRDAEALRTEGARAAYEKLFELLELAGKCRILSPNATWQVSSGEIAIHPYRERIMALVQGKNAVFYTNCMKYDELVAKNLHDNPQSAINLSIDAGTPATWRRVKGVDNFDQVVENLSRYYARSARPGQITLKYIVLPGVNDIYEDYLSLAGIMKVLEARHLTIARDTRRKYALSPEERAELTGAAAYLLAVCQKNGITCDMYTFTKAEQEETVRLAKEILSGGQV